MDLELVQLLSYSHWLDDVIEEADDLRAEYFGEALALEILFLVEMGSSIAVYKMMDVRVVDGEVRKVSMAFFEANSMVQTVDGC